MRASCLDLDGSVHRHVQLHVFWLTLWRYAHAVPRRAAGDKRAYERLETEPGLDKFVADAEGTASGVPAIALHIQEYSIDDTLRSD